MIVAAGTILPVCTLKPYWGTAVKSLIIASGDIKAQYLESSLPSDVITLLYPRSTNDYIYNGMVELDLFVTSYLFC